MPGPRPRILTEVELEFMQVIWAAGGEVTTEDVQKALARKGRHLSDGSIRKVLSILLSKGHLSRRREGPRFVHRAEVRKDQARKSMAMDLLKRAFDSSAALMVVALFDADAVRESDIEHIKRLIDEAERKEGRET